MSTRHQNEHALPGSSCPLDLLEWYANGTLAEEEQAAVEAHLRACSACRARAQEWARLRQVMRDVSALTPEPRADLFFEIERRIDLASAPASRFSLRQAGQAYWQALVALGELFVAQARLIRRDLFWMPLFLVPVAAMMVYLPPPWQHVRDATALLAALLTALGIALLYGREVDPAREMTLVTPTSPRLVLGARCCLVFGYDLLINCGLILPFLTMHGVVTPAWFVTHWLAPLCFLSAIALLLSVVVSANTAVLVCLSLWALRLLSDVPGLLLGGTSPVPEARWQQLYEAFWHQGPLLFAIAVLAVALAFGALERKERFAQ